MNFYFIYACMLYGCIMMLIPCVLMSSMMMWSFIQGTALYAQTTASREYVLDCVLFAALWHSTRLS